MGRYHIKEVNQSLIHALKYKLKLLDLKDRDVEGYEREVKELKKEMEK
jgi:hypothetical protein